MSSSRSIEYPPYLSIMLLSACTLAYEVLLMRLFSIIQWHHFAYMIIGLALLGYGSSGTLVTLFQDKLIHRYKFIFLACIASFSLTSLICFILAQSIPFNAEEILWDWNQSLYLVCIFTLLTIPFFFAATAICLTFMRYQSLVPPIYAMDLLGAGIGCLTVIMLLTLLFPQWALVGISIICMFILIVAGIELSFVSKFKIVAPAIIIIGIYLIAGSIIELSISPYKGLSQLLRITGTEIIEEKSSPLGMLSIVASHDIPLRHVPGMSLNSKQEPPAQIAIFTDGDNISVMTKFPESLAQLAYLDQVTSALPYHLSDIKNALIIGAGGGTDVLQAKFHQVPNISAVEINPQLVQLVNEDYGNFTGKLYQQKDITVHVGEARDFLNSTEKDYELIQLALIDAFSASISGLYALNESYLYTIEALKLYLERLQPNGYLAVTRWIKLPPRDTLKLFATATVALRQTGVSSPDKSIVLIRSWQTSTILLKKGIFTDKELAAIETFCRQRSFDMAYIPGLQQHQTNQYNVLSSPLFYRSTKALLSNEANSFINDYKFNLKPATDDQPFFHNFFKWSSFNEIYQLRHQGSMPLFEWGYLILIITLIAACILSLLLIVLPMWFFQRMGLSSASKLIGLDVLLYFFTIGLAFLFVEISFIQKFTQFLHHPIYSIVTILSAFLIFAGVGSQLTIWLMDLFVKRTIVTVAVLGIASLCLFYLIALDPIFAYMAAEPVGIKLLLSCMLIAPLAVLMGMPFPLAMASLSRFTNYYIPWAWGINGCASVISAVLATILAIHYGFTVVIIMAVILYLTIIFTFPESARPLG